MVLQTQTKVTISKQIGEDIKNITILGKGKGQRISKRIAKQGYWKALSIAPHYSGALKRGLSITPTKGGAKVVLTRPDQSDRRDGKKLNYHLWINGLGEFPELADNGHIKSGQTRFMQKAGDFMEKQQLKQILKWMKSKHL